MKIYDILGQEVRTLINENKPAGYHSVVWDGKDNSGQQLSSGVYFYSLKLNKNICRDKDDDNILFLAKFIKADLIITGDKDLLV